MTMTIDLDDTVYLISLVTKDEKLTGIELEHLFNMLVILYDEFSEPS